MIPRPHGGDLVNRVLSGSARDRALERARGLPALTVEPDVLSDAVNIAIGAYSPLEGFMNRRELAGVLEDDRLPSGVPWTVPIVLDVDGDRAGTLGDEVALATPEGRPFAVLHVTDRFPYDRELYARRVFGTTDREHPGVASLLERRDTLLGGPIDLLEEPPAEFPRYTLTPLETRALFEGKGWSTVVGFQTRNVPHLGHEYLQKTALTFVDGLYVNPVIGRKKAGDFKDEVILATYEALLASYYVPGRSVMGVLRTEMRYAGPKEAIFHAIVRKNFGCSHFIVGRDHAGVGSYYGPFEAQEIFGRFPDLGMTPLFFNSFFLCKKCGSVSNEKTCPHGDDQRVQFSGTLLRNLITTGEMPEGEMVRSEVARVLLSYGEPFVA